MPLTIQTVPIGDDFDGTPDDGEVLLERQAFGGTNPIDESRRVIIYNISLQGVDDMSEIDIRLAPTLADATPGSGNLFLQLAYATDAKGITKACCNCVVPPDWNLYAFTTGGTTAERKLMVDWMRATSEKEF